MNGHRLNREGIDNALGREGVHEGGGNTEFGESFFRVVGVGGIYS